jgi:alcohol dehydrogenase class IV
MDEIDLGGNVPARIGAGAAGRIAEAIVAEGGAGVRVLLVADGGLKPFGHVERLTRTLENAGHPVAVFDRIQGEPKETQVEAALAMGRAHGAEIVVCLGGGSALDAGKIAAALMREDGARLTDFRLAAKKLPASGLPAICLPTTAGTGSEMTPTSVLSAPDGTKYWYWGAPLYARLAILDPELSVALPPAFTAMTGMDALVHAVEAATNRSANRTSEAPAFEAIRLAADYLPRAVEAPVDLEARSAMLRAAALGGVAIDRAGTALAHNIGHAIGSLAPVPHGHAVAIAMAATLPWVAEGNPTAFARVAEAMEAEPDPQAVAPAFADLAARAKLGLDLREAAPQITAEALAVRMAAPENAAMRRATVREVRDEDLLPLARMVVGQEP